MKNFSIYILCFISTICKAQNTVGLITYETGNQDGYTLFAPLGSTKTYLIDKCGEKVKEWSSAYKPGQSVYLLDDGSLLRAGSSNNTTFTSGGSGGLIEKYDWDGNLTWTFTLSNDSLCQHHDFMPMNNGNILVISWVKKTYNEAVAMGKNPATTNAFVWSERILEIQPVGTNQYNLIWEWNVWDHLIQDFDSNKANYGVVADHPELIDINYVSGPPTSQDWIHLNSVDYNETLDQIMMSSHNFDEIWIIDHSSNTSVTANHSGGNSGKGGDLLFRWGNPKTYDRGTTSDQKLFGQHHATWIPEGFPNAGKIMYFNNGSGRPAGAYSSVEYLTPPANGFTYTENGNLAFLPLDADFVYTDIVPTDFYAPNISGAYPLENGGFIITNGPNGILFEINALGEKLWEYVNPVATAQIFSQGETPTQNLVFRANFYRPDFVGFTGKTLIPSGEIELNPSSPSICELANNPEIKISGIGVYPNPFNDQIFVKSENQVEKIEIYSSAGQKIISVTQNNIIDANKLQSGMYVLKVYYENQIIVMNVIKQ